MERQHVAGGMDRIGLVKDRSSIGQLRCLRIPEAADAGQRPEVMVERSVLLHQQDDMLDVAEAARLRGLASEEAAHVWGHERSGRGSGHSRRGAEQPPARDTEWLPTGVAGWRIIAFGHDSSSFNSSRRQRRFGSTLA
jgi:hypothetical protein